MLAYRIYPLATFAALRRSRRRIALSLTLVLALVRMAAAQEPRRLPDAPVLPVAFLVEQPEATNRPPASPPAAAPLAESAFPQTAELLQRLNAAEKRIADLERSKNDTAGSGAPIDPMLFNDEFKDQLGELWETHQGKKKSTRPTVNVFGRMHLEALGFPNASPGIDNFENPTTGADVQNRIQFRRIRLGAQGNILQTGIYRVEFDLGNPSRPTFRDTYVGFEELPYLQTLLIGNQKRPLGLDSWHSNQHVVFFERPLVVNAFNPNYRRIGIESYGHSENDNLNWQFGVFELQDIKGIGRDSGNPLHFSFNTRVSGTPWYDEDSGGRGYLHLGIANMYASTLPYPSASGDNGELASFDVKPELQTTSGWLDTGTILGATSFNVTGLESALNIGSLQFQAEYLATVVNRPTDQNLLFQGGYVQAAYFLTGEYEAWDRETGRLERPKPLENFFLVRKQDGGIGGGWGAWQIAARWSYLTLTDKDIHGGRQEDVTLGLNWYWTPHSKLMFNLVSGNIQDRAPVNGFTGGTYTGLGARVLMDF
jgi:phosphate-selective porin OprO/OprP